MTSADRDDRLHELVRVLLDEEIGDAELHELAGLLRDDPRAVQRYLACMALDAELRWECGHAAPPVTPADRSRRGPTRTGWAMLGAAAVAAIVIVVAILPGRNEAPVAAAALTLDHVTGDVLIADDDGARLNGEPGRRLPTDVTVTTRGPMSLARLAYDDGAWVLVAGDSVARFAGREQKTLAIRRGAISASVAPQPAGNPLLATTPHARVEVLGTTFSLAATAEETDLEVAAGTVKLTRVSDGASIVVPSGKRVEASGSSSELVVHDARPSPDVWGEDFEAGLPAAWLRGAFAASGLPPGSQGAVKAALDQETQVYGVSSPHPWMRGLFIVHPDTHLHITFKMSRPDWINLFFITRMNDTGSPATNLYKFNQIPSSPADAGRWRQATIPLRDFQRKSARGFEDSPPETGELVFGISCNAPAPDRGLVIDRIWVTRGGPRRFLLQDVD